MHLPMYIQGASASKVNDITSFSFLCTHEELIEAGKSNTVASDMFIKKLGNRITVNRFAENAVTMMNYEGGLNFEYGASGRGYNDNTVSGWTQNALNFTDVPLPKKISLKLYYPSNVRAPGDYALFQIRVKTPENNFAIILDFHIDEAWITYTQYNYLKIGPDVIKTVPELTNTDILDEEFTIDHSKFDTIYQNRKDLEIGISSPNYYYWSTGNGGNSLWAPTIQRLGMSF